MISTPMHTRKEVQIAFLLVCAMLLGFGFGCYSGRVWATPTQPEARPIVAGDEISHRTSGLKAIVVETYTNNNSLMLKVVITSGETRLIQEWYAIEAKR